jgi:hypothetical protein
LQALILVIKSAGFFAELVNVDDKAGKGNNTSGFAKSFG